MVNWVEQSLATQYADVNADVNADAEQINFMLDDDNDLENKAIFLKKNSMKVGNLLNDMRSPLNKMMTNYLPLFCKYCFN